MGWVAEIVVSIAGAIIVVGAALLILGSSQLRRDTRRQLLLGVSVRPFDGERPLPAQSAVDELEACGFETIGMWQWDTGGVVVALWREGTFAEVVVGPPAAAVTVEVTTVVGGRRGLLVTSNEPRLTSWSGWNRELRQFIPGATAMQLVERHDGGLRFLADSGLPADVVAGDEYGQVRRRAFELRAEELSRHQRRIAEESRRILAQEPADFGLIADLPTTPRKIAYIRQAAPRL